mmetsp:Transcript_36022/g.92797  ORF Transcript_36022/g.92797 Transcript_36022/m.92797 type:complete len:262 (+) Transcript_36022:723-1508(+)
MVVVRLRATRPQATRRPAIRPRGIHLRARLAIRHPQATRLSLAHRPLSPTAGLRHLLAQATTVGPRLVVAAQTPTRLAATIAVLTPTPVPTRLREARRPLVAARHRTTAVDPRPAVAMRVTRTMGTTGTTAGNGRVRPWRTAHARTTIEPAATMTAARNHAVTTTSRAVTPTTAVAALPHQLPAPTARRRRMREVLLPMVAHPGETPMRGHHRQATIATTRDMHPIDEEVAKASGTALLRGWKCVVGMPPLSVLYAISCYH